MIAAEAATVWRLLTVPEEMNRWSEATITAVIPGATRRVAIPLFGLHFVLDEEILEAEPPRRLVYRVTSGGGVRTHRGVQTLEPLDAAQTRIHWTIEFDPWIPGTGPLLRALLRPKLDRSLAGLARVAASS